MQPNDITFFQRFQDDIVAGRKTITLRDAAESHFKTGDILRVGRYEDDGYFCTIEVLATSTVTLDTLTERHAEQENMTLPRVEVSHKHGSANVYGVFRQWDEDGDVEVASLGVNLVRITPGMIVEP